MIFVLMEYSITLLKFKKTKEEHVPGKDARRDLLASAANVMWVSAWHAISHFILNEDGF